MNQEESKVVEQLTTKQSFHLKNLFLDPNNYRFIDEKDYKFVPRENLLDEKIQRKTRNFIEGDKRVNISDLIESFKANGYIPVEKIQVKRLGNNQYLVLEGNRRTTALKALQEDYENGKDIGKLDPAIFKKVDVEPHDEENEQTHLLVMGLKHIGGNIKWPAVNQAKFMKDYIEKFDGEYSEAENSACKTLGISKQKLRQSLRALGLIEQYKLSDFGDQFVNDKYSIFEEIVKSPDIKEWIGWDDYEYKSRDVVHTERLFDWLSFVENDDEENDSKKPKEPIITKSAEIRQLKVFINEESALQKMEDTRSLAVGLLSSANREQINIQDKIDTIKKNVALLSEYKNSFDIDAKNDLEELYVKLSKLVPQKAYLNTEYDYNTGIYFEVANSCHFKSLDIVSYKVFQNFKIDKLNKINIFAGLNNTGKTSLLEAIYLLTKQNDLNAFFEIMRLKNKFEKLSPLWVHKTLNGSKIEIEGVFNNISTGIAINKFEADENIDKSGYITSVEISSFIDDDISNNTKIDLYDYSAMKIYYDSIKVLCNSMFKSPFFYKESDILISHQKSVEKKAISYVIEFLKKIDSNIVDVDLTEDYGIKRFLVDSMSFKDKRVDLTSYGEGLQRIFEISLSFAYAKNGVILIDEIETGIHHSLLIEFTKFIQELSDMFNVQVFVTSHSKECIDAFVKNDYQNEEISAYHLQNQNGKIVYQYSDGERFARLVENMDLDMRGAKNE